MKAKIHPEYHAIKVDCVCGATYETHSTLKFSKVDICSHCHPFYSGKQKVLDTEGRIEKFKKKYGDYASNLSKTKATK
jgi:large subunit ribosomal protein L31